MVSALFLGPKSENRNFFKQMLDFVMDEHIHWRRDFHPSDKPVVSLKEQRSDAYAESLMRTEEALLELSARLKSESMPFFSPRYLGHMISDTLMAANLGYLATILYNPNNCSYEASSASTKFELEVGEQLCELFGYEKATSWGHLTSGGTVANFEAVWVARNLKSLLQAVRQTRPELLSAYNFTQQANLPPKVLLGILARIKEDGGLQELRQASAQYKGAGAQLGKLLVPQSKHYSWTKAVDIFGLGQDSLVPVPVGPDFRMDLEALETIVNDLIESQTPIVAVVAVAGTTESGAVDEIHHIVDFKRHLEERGTGFYLHIDGAYGGYVRALFKGEDGTYLPYDEVQEICDRRNYFSAEAEWPNRDIYEAFGAIRDADSVTVDPHKLGYVPYAAGGIVMKDRRALDLISYFAAYTFEEDGVEPHLLGAFIMEGSRPGASAASVWMAHRVVPLNIDGYGKILAHSIDGAQRLYNAFQTDSHITVGDRTFEIHCPVKPDLNVVNFLLQEEGVTDLEETNRLNRFLYNQCSYRSGPVYLEDFILSKTILNTDVYTKAVPAFVKNSQQVDGVFILRSCLMTPYLTSNRSFSQYKEQFWAALKRHLARYAEENPHKVKDRPTQEIG